MASAYSILLHVPQPLEVGLHDLVESLGGDLVLERGAGTLLASAGLACDPVGGAALSGSGCEWQAKTPARAIAVARATARRSG